MRDSDNPGLPPPKILEALRAPRRPRLDDPTAREIFRRWRRLGRPIAFAEFEVLADFLMPDPGISVERIHEILAAVEAAGIAVSNNNPTSLSIRLALRRIDADVWKWRAKLVTDLAQECDDDDPQKPRYLQTAQELLDRAKGKTTWFGRAMI